eukprot:CAMPEP_0172527836 /NCGR_PEP_ID=MMETSP1067-20121228/2401_1 /TAXON_ID=265564 ORGANISM="Thalassiosira punctigera, Strain Tpunct2005C2" /NCGR_SAMPLE_ID=MMETSP1067 /ASSEMBLY_ACC=CAM_ASM_000444 /LENGTH=135 /DNA_ID=CAMNT_0013311645 /DNA_START=44 /DNA_END=451 /DNA_ORIENTATION=-
MTRTSARPIALLVVLLAAVVALAAGYSSSPKSTRPITKPPAENAVASRGAFLSSTSAACLTFLGASQPSSAKEVDPALKGTKADPAYQTCLGNCLYDCTKPKGAEQRSRAECIPECKKKCATTKAQLLVGEPKKE